MLERHAIQELHGDKCLAVVLADIVDRADVRVVQSRCRLRFSLKAGQRLRVAGNFVGVEFQGNEAMQTRVLAL